MVNSNNKEQKNIEPFKVGKWNIDLFKLAQWGILIVIACFIIMYVVKYLRTGKITMDMRTEDLIGGSETPQIVRNILKDF